LVCAAEPIRPGYDVSAMLNYSRALVLILFIALAWRAWLLAANAVPFNSDEAVVGLMARHILQGRWPIFFYGQAYMGSLDATLVAGVFAVLGESVAAIRLVQVILYLLYIVSVWALARAWFVAPRVAPLAAGLAALPPVLISTYTTVSLGGYVESIFLGNLILLFGWRLIFGGQQHHRPLWLGLGLVGGLAFWTLGVAVIYLLPVAFWGLWRWRLRLWREYGLALVMFFIASSPWWLSNLWQENAALLTLLGWAEGGAGETITIGPLERALGLVGLGLPVLFGLRPPWSAEYFSWPIVAGGLTVFCGVIAWGLVSVRRGQALMAPGAGALLSAFFIVFVGLFIGTHFGRDATGRYFLPLFVVIILMVAAWIDALWRRRAALGIGGLALALAVNVSGTVLAAESPEKLTTQFDPVTRWDNAHDAELIDFLRRNNLTRGYSNYWVVFRLAFLSHEELQYSAALPYKPDRYTPADNRYPPYPQAVALSPQVAYITTFNPSLDEALRRNFAALRIAFDEQVIGPYRVFFNLSRRVAPEELPFPLLPQVTP